MTWYNPRANDTDKTTQSISRTDEEAMCSKSWLEALPSSSGTLLAAILANIMTEGLTLNQQNILGNFISSVGSLISYKAAQGAVDTNSE